MRTFQIAWHPPGHPLRTPSMDSLSPPSSLPEDEFLEGETTAWRSQRHKGRGRPNWQQENLLIASTTWPLEELVEMPDGTYRPERLMDPDEKSSFEQACLQARGRESYLTN